MNLIFSDSSDLFLTCAKSEIRIWSTKTNQEIVRITVPNMTCNAIELMRCGTSIISGEDSNSLIIRSESSETSQV